MLIECSLENPCLPHLEPLPYEGNGHALTATMSLTRLPPPENHVHQNCHGTGSTNGSNQVASKSSPGHDTQNPALIFNNLMKLSHEIILEREISPIQAWSYLIQQPWARQLEIRKVNELSEILLQYIYCHGYVLLFSDVMFFTHNDFRFGAVIGRGQFDHSIDHIASSIQTQR